MVEGKLLTKETRTAMVNRELPPVQFEVEKSHIARFAASIGDHNPLWADSKEAHEGPNGGIVAPPTFLRAVPMGIPDPPELAHLNKILDAASDWEYFEQVRPGDSITAQIRITGVTERTLSLGPAVFLILETTYSNQNGSPVAKQKSTFIRYGAD